MSSLGVTGSSGSVETAAMLSRKLARERTARIERTYTASSNVRRAAVRSSAARDSVYRRNLVFADLLAAVGAVLVSAAVARTARGPLPVGLATVPLIVMLSGILGAYSRGELLARQSTLDEIPRLFQLATIYTLVAWLADFAIPASASDRGLLVSLWCSLMVFLIAFRTVARSISRRITPPERCLILGADGDCAWLRAKIGRSSDMHTQVVAAVGPELIASGERSLGRLSAADLKDLITALRIERLIVMPIRDEGNGVDELIDKLTSLGLKVSVLPRVLELLGPSVEFDDIEGVPLLSTRNASLNPSARTIKRTLDVTASLLLLIVLFPFLALVALAIKLDSRGPVLYRQRRIGCGGEEFEIKKFRTMVEDAHARRHELRHLNEAQGLFKIADDPRVTRVGRLLRQTSLDELPQLLNVLRGEMSLVGPRPLLADEDQLIEGYKRRRLQLTPGMTGHWQVLGSARIPLTEMARIDYLYVTNWSLWLDMKILMRTVSHVLSLRGM
jgi:exopolysaccharide biosynthesis polyprenyl glycosylphosphotransferase